MKTPRIIIRSFGLLLLVIAMFAGSARLEAQYSVYSFAGDVQIKHAGKLISAANDLKITTADRIIVGPNSSVQILNGRDSRIYACDTPGEHTLSGIMLDAENESNSSALHRRMRMGKGDAKEGTMYVEKGKVTRALATFDPDAQGVQTDPEALARFVGQTMVGGDYQPAGFPVAFENAEGTFGFSFTNTGAEPLYINIIKVNPANMTAAEVSELGQPVGSYVILPGQTLARRQATAPDAGEKHLLIAAHYYFSIDDLVEALRKVAPADGVPVVAQPVFIANINI